VSTEGPRPAAAGPDAAPDATASSLPGTTPETANAEPAPDAAPERRWVWMDRWDPGTWEMPSNPTKLQRVLAGVALLIVAFATFYLPFKILGVF
jgi:hypothetical protein